MFWECKTLILPKFNHLCQNFASILPKSNQNCQKQCVCIPSSYDPVPSSHDPHPIVRRLFDPLGFSMQRGCNGRRSFLHIWDASARVPIGHCWYLVVDDWGRPDGRTPREICLAISIHQSDEERELHHHDVTARR